VRTVDNIMMELARSLSQGHPESEDSVIVVPNNIIGTFFPIKPMEVVVPQATTQSRGSTWNQIGFLRTATGGSSVDLLSLSRGLWMIQSSISASFNYQEGSAGASVAIEAQPNGTTIPLASLTAGGTATQLCAVQSTRTIFLLLPVGAPIRIVFTTNIAAQTMVGQCDIIANAMLSG
jgi:hypothetical protein